MFWKNLDWKHFRGTLCFRICLYIAGGVGIVLLTGLLLIFFSQRNFLLSAARRHLAYYSSEFEYEYMCQQEEPLNSSLVSEEMLPASCRKSLAQSVPPILPRCAYFVKNDRKYRIAAVQDGVPVLVIYDEASGGLACSRTDPHSALPYLDAEFNEEAYARGTNELFLLLTDDDGDIGARSDFDIEYVGIFRSLFNLGRPRDGIYYLHTGKAGIMVSLRRLYDGNCLIVGMNMSASEKNLRHLLGFFGLLLLIFIPLGGLLAFIISRKMTDGLARISEAAGDISRGNFDRRVAIKNESSELDSLVHAFNVMADNTQKLLVGLQEVTDDIAHDIRTPLTRMKALAELELMKSGDRDFPALVAEQCDDMLQTINTMLEITRIEKKIDHSRLVPVNLNNLLSKIHEAFSTLAEDKNIEFTLMLPAKEADLICSPRQFERMVANLIDNALKYTASGGHVALSLKNDGTRLALAVSDDGAGISEENLPKIFDRFFRGDASRSQQGNGLGLSMVKAVVSSLDGNLEVQSKVGQGTTFVLTFNLNS